MEKHLWKKNKGMKIQRNRGHPDVRTAKPYKINTEHEGEKKEKRERKGREMSKKIFGNVKSLLCVCFFYIITDFSGISLLIIYHVTML